MEKVSFFPTGSFRPPAPIPRATVPGLFALLRTIWRNPIETWARVHFEQPIVMHDLPFGQVAVVTDPTALRHVLLENSDNYHKDIFQKRILSFLNGGLLTAEGQQWRVQRRALAPIFARRTVQGYAPAVQSALHELLTRWRECDRAILDVAAESARFTLDVLQRTIFSEGLGGDPDELRQVMRDYFEAVGRIDPFDIFGLPDFVPRLSRLPAHQCVRKFDAAIDSIIATRRASLCEARQSRGDILDRLLNARTETGEGLSEPEIRANVITFMSAGHETTANTISWTLFLLSQSPGWREQVLDDIDQAGDTRPDTLADSLPTTRAVIEETLRLYPPIVSLSRIALGPDELAGKRIRPGTMVVMPTYVLHRHRRLWERPDEFDPTRFLPHARARIDRYAYLPFGAGTRACIGSTFALQEATLAVAAITHNFHLQCAAGHRVWPLMRVTLRPRGGLPMQIRVRARAPRQGIGDDAWASLSA